MFALALALGVYVWSVVQSLGTRTTEPAELQETQAEDILTQESVDVSGDPAVPTRENETAPTAPIVIDVASLSDTQRGMLESLGFTGSTIVLTPAMLACGEKVVGSIRLREIANGSAPSPLEAVKLIPCFR